MSGFGYLVRESLAEILLDFVVCGSHNFVTLWFLSFWGQFLKCGYNDFLSGFCRAPVWLMQSWKRN